MSHKDLDQWLFQIGTELQRLSEEMTHTGPMLARSARWEPRIDLVEREHDFILIAEIAGVRGDDIRLAYNAERNALVIRGCRHEEPFAEEGNCAVHQLEIYYGEFLREIPLPDVPISQRNIHAQYRNGFLYVVMPKAQTGQSSGRIRRTITIERL